NLGFQLPQFIPLPLYPDGNAPPKLDQKKPVMLIGNSKNAYNNHLDVIRLLHQHSTPSAIFFKLFFSYGRHEHYGAAVQREAKGLEQVTFIERFLPKAEFEQEYREASALVINSYRQLALANIFAAI